MGKGSSKSKRPMRYIRDLERLDGNLQDTKGVVLEVLDILQEGDVLEATVEIEKLDTQTRRVEEEVLDLSTRQGVLQLEQYYTETVNEIHDMYTKHKDKSGSFKIKKLPGDDRRTLDIMLGQLEKLLPAIAGGIISIFPDMYRKKNKRFEELVEKISKEIVYGDMADYP